MRKRWQVQLVVNGEPDEPKSFWFKKSAEQYKDFMFNILEPLVPVAITILPVERVRRRQK